MSKSTFSDTMKSIGAAFFGVQSDKNREKDFTQGNAVHFIVAGILSVGLFIGALVLVVYFVIPS